MVIHPPEVHTLEGKARVSARVELQTPGKAVPDVLWYEFPESYREYISGYADGFATALLLLAMERGEKNLRVHGALSARLLYNLREYQRIFNAWFPPRFKHVEIEYDHCGRPPGHEVAGAVATAFSGGIDSSYTLWSQLPTNEDIPGYQLSHALFVHGFDIPLADKQTFLAASAAYKQRLGEVGVELIPVVTNVREFLIPPRWALSHGTALGSVALMLDRLLSRFYIPASFPYTDLAPWGSHLVADHLMSTETLDVVHHGCMARVDKIAKVADWEQTYSFLRVCWEHPDAYKNCSRCYNCVLTMIALELAQSLDKYKTFVEPLNRSKIRNLRLPPEEIVETGRVIERAIAAGRMDIAEDLRHALRYSKYAAGIKRMQQRFVTLGRLVSQRIGLSGRVPTAADSKAHPRSP